jgi:hypothetical protein
VALALVASRLPKCRSSKTHPPRKFNSLLAPHSAAIMPRRAHLALITRANDNRLFISMASLMTVKARPRRQLSSWRSSILRLNPLPTEDPAANRISIMQTTPLARNSRRALPSLACAIGTDPKPFRSGATTGGPSVSCHRNTTRSFSTVHDWLSSVAAP